VFCTHIPCIHQDANSSLDANEEKGGERRDGADQAPSSNQDGNDRDIVDVFQSANTFLVRNNTMQI
jgi:hypothetical protein